MYIVLKNVILQFKKKKSTRNVKRLNKSILYFFIKDKTLSQTRYLNPDIYIFFYCSKKERCHKEDKNKEVAHNKTY